MTIHGTLLNAFGQPYTAQVNASQELTTHDAVAAMRLEDLNAKLEIAIKLLYALAAAQGAEIDPATQLYAEQIGAVEAF